MRPAAGWGERSIKVAGQCVPPPPPPFPHFTEALRITALLPPPKDIPLVNLTRGKMGKLRGAKVFGLKKIDRRQLPL